MPRTLHDFICVQCGNMFMARNRGAARIPQFCSKTCLTNSRKGKLVLTQEQQKVLSVNSRKRVICTCKVCSKQFEKRPSEVAAGRGVHCSKKCAAVSIGVRSKTLPRGFVSPQVLEQRRVAAINKLPLDSRKCVICRTEFTPKLQGVQCCSKKCGHKLQGQKISGSSNMNYATDAKVYKCKTCSKEFRRTFGLLRHPGSFTYCSKSCFNRGLIKQVSCTCPQCGKQLIRKPSQLVAEGVAYCSQSCYLTHKDRDSYKVRLMEDWLSEYGLKSERNKTFEWLRNPDTGRNLFIDIFVPSLNLAIEYDGKQHFVPTLKHQTQESVIAYQKRDRAKDILCQKYTVKMLRFAYNQPFSKKLFTSALLTESF